MSSMTTEIVAKKNRAAIMSRIQAGDAEVTDVDDLTVDGDGRIVAIQQRFAHLIGAPELAFVQI